MKLLKLFNIALLISFITLTYNTLSCEATRISLPMIYKWSKRNKEVGACKDPTEPFQCLGSNVCISLQYLCDGQPGDCPNDSDESEALCLAMKRPTKDLIKRFLLAQYTNYGTKYIEYLFGAKVAKLVNKDAKTSVKVFEVIATALIVSPTVEQFAPVFEMDNVEKERFINVLSSINNGQVDNLPKFIVDSASEGLITLTDKLIKTNFLDNKSNSE